MPLPTKPYRRRFPLSRKGRLAKPSNREVVTIFEIDHHRSRYPAHFLLYFDLCESIATPEYSSLPLLLQRIRERWESKKILTLTDHEKGITTIRVTAPSKIGAKLAAYFNRNRIQA